MNLLRVGLHIDTDTDTDTSYEAGPLLRSPIGSDAVGMSTVPEVILARHQGIPICALSVITNYAAGMSETDISHEQTIAFASKAADTVEKLLNTYLESQ